MGWSADAYRKMMMSLLPLGRAWNREEDGVLSKVLGAMAEEMGRLDGRVDDLLNEIVPSVTTELIDEWEDEFAVPDSCRPNMVDSLAGRRYNLLRRFLRIGRQDGAYFEWLADTYALGTFELPPSRFLKAFVDEEPPETEGSFDRGFSTSFDRLLSNVGSFFLRFYDTGQFEFILFTADQGRAGDSLARIPFVDKANCVIQKWKPAHCRVNYRVEGAPFQDGIDQVRNSYALLVDGAPTPTNFRFWDWATSGTTMLARAAMEWLEYHSRHYSFSIGGDGTEEIELRQPNDTEFIPLYPPYPMSIEHGGYAKIPADLVLSAVPPDVENLSQRVVLQFPDGTDDESLPITLGPSAQDWTEHSDAFIVAQDPPAFGDGFDEGFALYSEAVGYGKALVSGFRPRLVQKFYQGDTYLDDLFVKFSDYVIQWPSPLESERLLLLDVPGEYGKIYGGDHVYESGVSYYFPAVTGHIVIEYESWDLDYDGDAEIWINGHWVADCPESTTDMGSGALEYWNGITYEADVAPDLMGGAFDPDAFAPDLCVYENVLRSDGVNHLEFRPSNPDRPGWWGIRKVKVWLKSHDGCFERGTFDWAFDFEKGGEFDRLEFGDGFPQPIDDWYKCPWGDLSRDEFSIGFNIT